MRSCGREVVGAVVIGGAGFRGGGLFVIMAVLVVLGCGTGFWGGGLLEILAVAVVLCGGAGFCGGGLSDVLAVAVVLGLDDVVAAIFVWVTALVVVVAAQKQDSMHAMYTHAINVDSTRSLAQARSAMFGRLYSKLNRLWY